MKLILFKACFIILLLSSCNNNSPIIKKEVIDYLSVEVLKTIPDKKGLIDVVSTNIYSPVFILSSEKEQIVLTRVDYLYIFFVESEYKNKYKTFNEFLNESLNQKIKFDKGDLIHESRIFKINKKIRIEYEKKSFDTSLSSYLLKENNSTYIDINKIKNTEEYYTLIYYLFINNYYITKDDYAGKTYVHYWNEKL